MLFELWSGYIYIKYNIQFLFVGKSQDIRLHGVFVVRYCLYFILHCLKFCRFVNLQCLSLYIFFNNIHNFSWFHILNFFYFPPWKWSPFLCYQNTKIKIILYLWKTHKNNLLKVSDAGKNQKVKIMLQWPLNRLKCC